MIKRVIRKRIIYILPVFAILLSANALRSQVPTVTYDFNTNKLDSVLPFDQRFNIELSESSPDFDTINVSFIPVPNTKKVLNAKIPRSIIPGDSLPGKGKYIRVKNFDDSISGKEFFEYASFIKHPKYSVLSETYVSDTGMRILSVPYQLKYNHDYMVNFHGVYHDSLSSSQKKELMDDINDAMKIEMHKVVNSINGDENGDTINSFLFRFQNNARTIIYGFNKDYRFVTISKDVLKLRFRKEQDDFKNFYEAYRDISSNGIMQNSMNKNSFHDIDWYSLENEASKRNEITETYLSNYDADNDPYFSDRKAALEDNFQKLLDSRDGIIRASHRMVEDVIVRNVTVRKTLAPTYNNTVTENASLYFTIDLGYLYSMYLDDVLPTFTVSFYPRPVNPELPFGHYTGVDKILTRLSLVAGTTIGSITEEGKREGLVENRSLITGVGYRCLPFAKISIGTLIFKTNDPNPLVENYSTKLSWYIAVSLDIDVARTIKNAFEENF